MPKKEIVPAIMYDLDGFLSDNQHRLHLILNDKPDWRAYYKLTLQDKPILPAVLIYNALLKTDAVSIICTARHESNRTLTEAWLKAHNIQFYKVLIMRDEYDRATAATFKKTCLQLLPQHGFYPVLAFDDDPSIVSMYRQNGVACYAADDHSWTKGDKHGSERGTN